MLIPNIAEKLKLITLYTHKLIIFTLSLLYELLDGFSKTFFSEKLEIKESKTIKKTFILCELRIQT